MNVHTAIPESDDIAIEWPSYTALLEDKIVTAPACGLDIDPDELHPYLKPHARDLTVWALRGGRRAIFAAFGLGKTSMQLEWARQIALPAWSICAPPKSARGWRRCLISNRKRKPMDGWKPNVCIYHHPCPDGFAAAGIVTRRWSGVVLVPANYGKDEPASMDIDGANVLVVDFSFKADVLAAMANRAASIVILDHHKTAQADLAAFAADWPAEVIGFDVPAAAKLLKLREAKGELPIVAHFDMEQSGAALTWRFCNPHDPVPYMIRLIEDRDLWRFALPETRAFSLYLRSFPFDFNIWNTIDADLSLDSDAVMVRARAIERFYDQLLADIVPTATLRSVGKWDGVPVAHAPYAFASDLGHALLKRYPDAPFAAVAVDAHGGRTWSLRSEDGRVDVSEVAKAFGGGGHRNAAGFRTPL